MVKKLELAVSLGFTSKPQHSSPTCLSPLRSPILHQKEPHHAHVEKLWSGKLCSPLLQERWTKTCCCGTTSWSRNTALCGTRSRDECGSLTVTVPRWLSSANSLGQRPWRKWCRWSNLRRSWLGTGSSSRESLTAPRTGGIQDGPESIQPSSN